MSAHILYPSLDKKYPSSISKKIMKNLLREKLGYTGITVTDALDMQGVLQDPKVNVDLRAFLAGNDILLMSTDVAKGIKAYNPILSGQLTREEIEASSKDVDRPLVLNKKDLDIKSEEKKSNKYVEATAFIPMIIPDIVMAISLLSFFTLIVVVFISLKYFN